MGQKKRNTIKYKQKIKRKKRRVKLSKKGKNPGEYFTSGIYIKRNLG